MNKQYVTWQQVRKFVDAVAAEYEDTPFSGVYGPPRGGLILAVMLSHKLAIPLLMAPADDCLIVDDIADTGETLRKYRQDKYTIATMYYHQQSVIDPDYWLFEKKDDWIVYPWEGDWIDVID